VSLEVTAREDLLETGDARRLQVAMRGAVGDDGSLALEVERVALEVRDRTGAVRLAVAPRPAGGDAPAAPVLEALRRATVRVGLDPAAGVVSVTGLDRAFERAEAAIGDDAASLASLASDAAWTRDLANAGLSAVPGSLANGASAERGARVRVAGRGETIVRLAGEAARDDRGSPAVHFAARLSGDAAFEGNGGPAPPGDVGAARVAEVTCEATTSYTGDPPHPLKGEWTVTTPFAGGATVRTTTSFTLVLR
jgi:hypothetical protein